MGTEPIIVKKLLRKAISYYEKTLPTKSTETINWEDIKSAKYFLAGSLSAAELKDFIIKPIEMILDPWLEMPSISYIYGNTGCGENYIHSITFKAHCLRKKIRRMGGSKSGKIFIFRR